MNMFTKSDPKKATDDQRRKQQRESNLKAKETYGLNMKQLRQWSKNRLEQESATETAKQQLAVAKVRTFLDAIATVIRMQSWYRMARLRKANRKVLAERREEKRLYFRAFKVYYKTEKLRYYNKFGKFFHAWKEETQEQKRLQKLIRTFFAMCISRMRLSPQAVMAYFNPGEWSKTISRHDMMKIRRLMLNKLFKGWFLEVRQLKNVRFKASQILARMMRRTKGPLWVKESTLVCYHMWFRYISVKRAFRRGEPDPRFTNPYLPQWTKLYREMTVARIKKKKSSELGTYLTEIRAFNKWTYLMKVDRTKPVTPLAVAISHFNTGLTRKVIAAWFEVIRERGKITRFRNKIFELWKFWAPKHHRLRLKNDEAAEWLRIFRVRMSFNAMISICLEVVGARTVKIKELRKNFCDRKLVSCAYAMLDMNEHVIMLDCWRRMNYYWRCARNWKNLQWNYSYFWYHHRNRGKERL